VILKAHGKCKCGVVVNGDLDDASREYVHRYSLPETMAGVARARATEVEGIRLVTFAPGDDWSVECPLCRSTILLSPGS